MSSKDEENYSKKLLELSAQIGAPAHGLVDKLGYIGSVFDVILDHECDTIREKVVILAMYCGIVSAKSSEHEPMRAIEDFGSMLPQIFELLVLLMGDDPDLSKYRPQRKPHNPRKE